MKSTALTEFNESFVKLYQILSILMDFWVDIWPITFANKTNYITVETKKNW